MTVTTTAAAPLRGREAPAPPFGPGQGRLRVTSGQSESVFETVRAESPLRILLPKPAGVRAACACLTSFGGGLVHGDALDVTVGVDRGSTLLLTTQSSTKVFRGSTRQRISADVEGTLLLLPDPVACFAEADHRSEIDVRLHEDGSLILVDAFTSGRAAYGERFAFERLESRIVVRRSGKRLVHDAVLLDARDGSIGARFGEAEVFATILATGPRVDAIVQALLRPASASPAARAAVAYAPSPLASTAGAARDSAIVRVLATSTQSLANVLRDRLTGLIDLLGIDPYASRW